MGTESNPDKNNKQTISRRECLKGLSSVGIGSIFVGAGNARVLDSDREYEKEIIFAYKRNPDGGEPIPKTKYVAKDWHNQVLHIRDIFESHKSRLSNKNGIEGIYQRPPIRNGENGKIIFSLNESTEGELRGELPEEIEGIETEIEVLVNKELNCDLQNEDYTPLVPGGAEVQAMDDGSVEGTLTSCSRLRDTTTNDARFATTAHGWEDSDTSCTVSPNKELRQPSFGTAVGEMIGFVPELDLAVLAPKGNNTPTTSIARNDTSTDVLAGYYTETGVDDLISDGKGLTQVGRTTCETGGTIDSKGNTRSELCNEDRVEQIRWGDEDDTDDGDSGGPYFRYEPDEDEYYKIGFHVGIGSSWFSTYAEGTAAYAVADQTIWSFA